MFGTGCQTTIQQRVQNLETRNQQLEQRVAELEHDAEKAREWRSRLSFEVAGAELNVTQTHGATSKTTNTIGTTTSRLADD
jgi:cell division septum initiation protein DivIVA